MKYRTYIIIVLFTFIGLILRLVDLNAALGFGDEYVHYQATNYILNDPKNILNITVLLVHAPLMWTVLPIFYKLLLPVFGDTILISRIASVISGTLFIPVIFLLMKKESELRAIVSVILISICGYLVILSRIGYPDMFIVVFFTLLLFAFLKFLKNITPKNAILFGLLFAFVILLKETTIVLMPSIALFILWERRDLITNKNFWLGMLLPFIIFLPILIFLILIILPNYVNGVNLLNFNSFYQSYLGRHMYLSNVPVGVFQQIFNFITYSSLPLAFVMLFGILYALWKRTPEDKFYLSVFASYLVFFSAMGREQISFSQYPSLLTTEFPQYDWHLWWVIPALILTSNALADSYEKYFKPHLTGNKKIWLGVLILVFILYIIVFDFKIIQTYNEYMLKNLQIVKITRIL
jgi:hypothetical protein